MNSIERRIERAEETLGMGQEPVVVNIVWFGGEPVPPERRDGNFIIRHIPYETIQQRREGATGHEQPIETS